MVEGESVRVRIVRTGSVMMVVSQRIVLLMNLIRIRLRNMTARRKTTIMICHQRPLLSITEPVQPKHIPQLSLVYRPIPREAMTTSCSHDTTQSKASTYAQYTAYTLLANGFWNSLHPV